MHQPVSYIQQTKDLYDSLGYEAYRWFRADSSPAFVTPPLPLSRSKLGLVSTAGTYLAGQIAYHYKDDTSVRAIPSDSEVTDIRFSHVTENYLVEARQDPRCVFPIEALRSLRDTGAIGDLADNFFSCMGGIYSQRRVNEELIPALEAHIENENIDALLLVPLWPVCHQTVCLIARHFENNGLPTIILGSALDILESGRPPRVKFLDYPLGFESGRPFDPENQLAIVSAALAGLDDMDAPGIEPLDFTWDEGWRMIEERNKDLVNQDLRSSRDTSPQYQTEQDRELAESKH